MKLRKLLSLVVALLVLSSCGLPVNKMTPEERKADMNWAFTVFKHNYAPAELKKSTFGVELSKVEADCVTLAGEDMSNQEFLSLFQKCVHMFRDAHVGAQQMNNGILPEYAQVAHLGFVGMRTKVSTTDGDNTVEALRIAKLLEGSNTPGSPLLADDIILEADGQPIDEYLKTNIVPYIHVGQDETNLSLSALRFGVRTSINLPIPEEDEIELKILRGDDQFNIKLPWIKEDLLAFQVKQNQQASEAPTQELKPAVVPETLSQIQNPLIHGFLGYRQLKTLFNELDPLEYAVDRLKLIAHHGFKWSQFAPVLRDVFEKAQNDQSSLLLTDRIFPRAEKVEDLMNNPLFPAKAVTTVNGNVYAYLQLASFPAEDSLLSEWFRAITAIEDKQIKSVIIDTIDNGGGSLIHGTRVLNMIRKQKKLDYPSIQARLNNNWFTTFKTQAAFGENDYIKALGAKRLKEFEEEQAKGKSLSRPFSVTSLDPFFLQNPEFGVSDDVKIALMVNEFCISMCDIFASVFQENNLGVIVGQTTMGGGGNVTQHGLAPVSKMGISMTESLIVSSSGKYLENNGIKPDITVDMVMDRQKGFPLALEEALKAILPQTPAPTPIQE